MENKYEFSPITDKHFKKSGVQALADRPNAANQYGQSGLSATQLKVWFDNMAKLLSEKINELQQAINGPEAVKYIGLAVSEYKTLDELIDGMQNGSFADTLLKLYPGEDASEVETLQDIIFDIAQRYSEMKEDSEDLDERKVEKVTDTNSYRRAYGVSKAGEQINLTVSEAPVGNAVAAYNENGILKTKMTPLPGYEAMANASEVVNMAFINELRKHIGAGLNIVLDHKTYEFYVEILNIDGQIIFTSTPIDLPLEEVVVRGDYADGKIILTLQSGEKIEVPVANMVNGLVTQAAHDADIKALNLKIDSALAAYISDVYNLVGGDYVDYS